MQIRLRSATAGVVAAVLSVAAITGLIFPLRHAVPAVSTGVLYLLAVLFVSTYWGLWLGLLTAAGSAAQFNFFHLPPTGRFTIADPENWVALGVFFVAAIVVSGLAGAARSRALEAETRRREADLAADLALVLLGGGGLHESFPVAAHRIAATVGLEAAALQTGWVDGDERRRALPLVDQGKRVATLLVPRSVSDAQRDQLERRVVPALSALVGAAQRGSQLEDKVVDSEAIRRSDELKTALLRSISHDLRSPLTAIRTAASALAAEDQSGSERNEIAEVIEEESERLGRLVDDLLDLSRLEAGTATPRRDWSSVEEVIEASTDAVGASGARFDVELDPELPLINVDAAQLERAIANLLENAVRYSEGEPVSIRARAHQRRLIVRVSDRGPGIAKHDLPHIFDPFYRADRQSTKGSGLGLAIARGFVEANGGHLRAQSLPGQGASFIVSLPMEHPAEGAATQLVQ